MTPDVRRLYCWRWCDACAPDVLLEVLIEQGKIVGVRRADGNYSGFPRGNVFLISTGILKQPMAPALLRHGLFSTASDQPREFLDEASTTGLLFFFAVTLFLLLRLLLAVAVW